MDDWKLRAVTVVKLEKELNMLVIFVYVIICALKCSKRLH